MKHFVRRPSPAMVVALLALIVAASGTAVAASKLKNGDRLIKKHSLSGNRLRNGTVTGTQIKLSTLGTVPSATNATNATSAQTAGVANSIGTVTYVKGSIVDAPANGGSGFGSSGQSVASCPTGMSVIGMGAFTGSNGTEVSSLSLPASGAPNQVHAYFNNFTNTDAPTNYAVAICANVQTISNPSGLATHAGDNGRR